MNWTSSSELPPRNQPDRRRESRLHSPPTRHYPSAERVGLTEGPHHRTLARAFANQLNDIFLLDDQLDKLDQSVSRK